MRGWSVGVALGVGALGLACAAPGSPVGVAVVTAGGIDPRVDQRLAEQVADELREYGFRVMVDPDPITAADPEREARSRASAADAANAVLLRPSAVEERDGVVSGTHLYAVDLQVQVVNHDPSHPVTTTSRPFVSEDHSAHAVAARVQDAWASGLTPWVAQQLYLTPDLAAAEAVDLEVAEIEGFQRLQELETVVSMRSEREQAYAAYCQAEREQLAAEGLCFGDPCGQYTLLGLDPSDRAIVQDISRVPIFEIPSRGETWFEPPERILAYPLDPPRAEQVLLRSGNFYGFGVVGPGAEVGAVELFGVDGTNAIYGFALADGARRTLALLGPGEESVFSRVSPGGEAALACLQHGRGCFAEAGGERTTLRAYRLAEWVLLPGGPQVVGQLATGDLGLDDPLGGAESRTTRLGASVREVVGLHDGLVRLIAQEDDGACVLVSVDPQLAVMGRDPMPVCLETARSLPDGRLVGTSWEAMLVWAVGAETADRVTTGSHPEEHPFPTRDGRRVVFNRRLWAPPDDFAVGGLYRRVVCVADLPPAGR